MNEFFQVSANKSAFLRIRKEMFEDVWLLRINVCRSRERVVRFHLCGFSELEGYRGESTSDIGGAALIPSYKISSFRATVHFNSESETRFCQVSVLISS